MNTRILFVLVVFVASLGAQGTITSTAPSSVISGAASFLVAVNGSGFTSANIVQWDGVNLSTAFASANQLAATVTASLVTSAGTHNIRVKQSALVNVFSNTVAFTVNNPVPTVATVSPSLTPFGVGPVTIDFTGTGFRAASIVRIGGTNLATTFIGTTHIQGVLTASMANIPGLFPMEVFNPPPGGGTAPSGDFTVQNQVPTLASISPNTVTAGLGGMNLIANGSNYNVATVVQFDGSPLPTNLLTSTQVMASVSSALVGSGANHTITVFNAGPGGGTTAGLAFTVNNPVPVLASLSPATVTIPGDTTVVAIGSNFVGSSVMLLDGVAISTAWVDGTHLSGTVHGATLPVGAHTITVFTPAPIGGTSTGQTLTANNPAPTLTSLNQSAAFAGGSGFTLLALGTGYNASSTILFDGSPLTTSLLSVTQLTAPIADTLLATAGNHTITVSNPIPGGGTSGGLGLSVTNAAPTLLQITPATVPSGSAFTLTAIGTGYALASTIHVDGIGLPTTWLDAAHVIASVPAPLIASVGTHAIRVNNPAPGGGISAALNLTVQNPVPAIGNLSPSTVVTGSPTTLTVTGSGFIPASVVRSSGGALPTTFVSPSQLTAVITPFGTAIVPVDVSNPTPGGGISGSMPLAIENPVPVVTSLSPNAIVVNTVVPPFGVNGTGFAAGSQILFDGTPIPTVSGGSNFLSANVPASALGLVAVHQVSVIAPGPGGGTSNSLPFTVGNPVPVISSISPAALSVANGGTTPTTVTLNGSGFMASGTADVVGQGAMSMTFLSPLAVTVSLPSTLVTSPGQLQIRITNPGPGGGTTLAPLLSVFNAIPVVTSATPVNPPFVASAGGSILVTGTGFHAASEVRIDTFPVPASFSGVFGTGSLTAAVPASFLIGGTHQLTVFNGGNGGGESAPIPFVFQNGVPVIMSLSTFAILGGGSDVTLTMTGLNFLFSSTATASGVPIALIPTSSTQVDLIFPASLQRSVGTFALTVTNPGPGGGSASIPFTVDGPVIGSCTPAVVPVMTGGSPPITFTVNGGAFQAGDLIRINGAVQPTTLLSPLALRCTLDGSMPVLLHPGGFAVTVTRPGSSNLVSSNAFGIPVGIVGTPDNAGTVTLSPAPPAPGQVFNLRVELPVASGPVTLLAEIPPPSTIMLNIAPGFDLVIGPGLNSPIVLTDGLGIFGPATPTFVAPYDLSSFPIPGGHGLFEIRDIGAPAVPIGITFSLAAVYVDPTSPIGINATHVGGPFSL